MVYNLLIDFSFPYTFEALTFVIGNEGIDEMDKTTYNIEGQISIPRQQQQLLFCFF